MNNRCILQTNLLELLSVASYMFHLTITDMMLNIIKHTVLYAGMLVLDLVSSGASSGVLSNGAWPLPTVLSIR